MLGAGATTGCDIANPDRLPPLINVSHFKRIFEQGDGYNVTTSPFAAMGLNKFFLWAIDFYEADLELLFTHLFFMGKIKNSTSGPQFVQMASRTYQDTRINRLATEVVLTGLYWGGTVGIRNILEMFSGALRAEIMNCLGTKGKNPTTLPFTPPSKQLDKIAKFLQRGDALVSYNYDDLMVYAALNAGRVDRNSFKNPLILDCLQQNTKTCSDRITVCTPHGSFSWRSSINDPYGAVYACYGQISPPEPFGVLPPLILPYKCKEELMQSIPIFGFEMALSLQILSECDELIVIGKQFFSGDEDLVDKLTDACKNKKRSVIYVDLSVDRPDWLKKHNEIFNVSSVQTFKSIQSFVDTLP